MPTAAYHTAQHLHYAPGKVCSQNLRLNRCYSISPPARQVLFSMQISRFLGEIYGCISTGKEANLHRATSVS